MATLDRREIDAQADAAAASVAVAIAGVDAAEAALSNATTEFERARNLFEKGALPRQRLDAAETANKAARGAAPAGAGQSRAGRGRPPPGARGAARHDPQFAGGRTRRRTQLRSGRHARRSPGRRHRRPARAEARSRGLGARGRPPQGGHAGSGRRAGASRADAYTGELAAIAPEVNERNRHFRVEIRVPNADAALLSGMYATARIVDRAGDRRRDRSARGHHHPRRQARGAGRAGRCRHGGARDRRPFRRHARSRS